MYHTYWGLQTAPFASEVEAAPSPTAASDEALARLQYLLEQQSRVGLLIGAAGTGKTTLLRRFCEASRRQGVPAALIGGKGADEHSLLRALADHWSLPASAAADERQLWQLLINRLAELRYEQTPCILALDDADQATADVRFQLERLLHAADIATAHLTLVLSCPTETAGQLGAALLDQVELRIDLLPWSEEETAQHVAERLLHCGSEQPIFTDEAISLLHELSGGIPRKVEQIARLALLAGAGQGLTEIDAVTLAEAFQELGTGGLSCSS